ncbi:hypothetical protein M514_25685 [Trichuris suis]|uniref:Uncharacterized protein n=1 Tax=Trichuris suis TaxID=68888 RepID=A0A085MXY7_9BILA|nr:hypothetical protein M514_25685 [Trichuris suis]
MSSVYSVLEPFDHSTGSVVACVDTKDSWGFCAGWLSMVARTKARLVSSKAANASTEKWIAFSPDLDETRRSSGAQGCRRFRNEAAIKIHTAQKATQFAHNSVGRNVETQELQAGLAENALVRVDSDSLCFVFLFCHACHQYVIQIHKAKVQSSRHLVHESLKSLRRAPQTKRHAQIFEEAERCSNCSFGDVFGVNRDLVVSTHEVNLQEYSPPVKSPGKIIEVWNRVSVWLCCIIQSAIIATWPPGAGLLLGHHMQLGCPTAPGWSDNSKL